MFLDNTGMRKQMWLVWSDSFEGGSVFQTRTITAKFSNSCHFFPSALSDKDMLSDTEPRERIIVHSTTRDRGGGGGNPEGGEEGGGEGEGGGGGTTEKMKIKMEAVGLARVHCTT